MSSSDIFIGRTGLFSGFRGRFNRRYRPRLVESCEGQDPEDTVPLQDVRAAAGPVTVTALNDQDALDSATVTALSTQLLARYSQDEACLVLGEAVRTHAARSSVPDATLICNARGLRQALSYVLQATTAVDLLTALYQAADGDTPEQTHPDCDQIGHDGTCLDEGTPPTEPEPEPDTSGGMIPPKENCLSTQARQDLIASMPVQKHHVASFYNEWGEAFKKIAGEYGLDLDSKDWNILKAPHRGPHPKEYHDWVYKNMESIDTIAKGDVEIFTSLFKSWVVETVRKDPTIVRVAYWECYREK